MKKFAKFFGKSLLALALGIIAVVGLGIAGLLTYYGQVVGTAMVSQGVVLEVYDDNENQLARAEGDGTPITLSAEVVAGSILDTFYYDGSKVSYLKISYLADGTVPAPLRINVALDENFDGLFTEVVKFGVVALNPANLEQVYYRVEINSTGVYLYGSDDNLITSGEWENDEVTIRYPSEGTPQFDFTVEKNEENKTISIYGNTIVLPQIGGEETSLIFRPFLVWNVATAPGSYGITFSVEPA
jgi:hypothetical protein